MSSDKVATEILSSNGWNLERATDYFFTNRTKYPAAATGKADQSKLGKIFDKYAAGSSDTTCLAEETLAAYFTDINVDPSSPVTLAVAYALKCKGFGEVTRKEFIDGWSALSADTLDKMKAEVARITASLGDKKSFREFYIWLFNFVKETPDRKSIDLDAAMELWTYTFSPKFVFPWPLIDEWLEFCKSNRTKMQLVSIDTWQQTLEFAREVKPDLSNWDADGAWPVVIDDFVEYIRSGKAKKRH